MRSTVSNHTLTSVPRGILNPQTKPIEFQPFWWHSVKHSAIPYFSTKGAVVKTQQLSGEELERELNALGIATKKEVAAFSREDLRRCIYDGWNSEEIANHFGVSLNVVRHKAEYWKMGKLLSLNNQAATFCME